MDTIHINELELACQVGVTATERAQPQTLLVSLEIALDLAAGPHPRNLRRMQRDVLLQHPIEDEVGQLQDQHAEAELRRDLERQAKALEAQKPQQQPDPVQKMRLDTGAELRRIDAVRKLAANQPEIRFFNVPENKAYSHRDQSPAGSWTCPVRSPASPFAKVTPTRALR